jgi:hypothetical protein
MAVPVLYSMVARRSRVHSPVSTSPPAHAPGANDVERFDWEVSSRA